MTRRILREFIGAFVGQVLDRIGLVNKTIKNIPPGDILPLAFHNPRKRLFSNLIEWLIINDFTFISTDRLSDIIEKQD